MKKISEMIKIYSRRIVVDFTVSIHTQPHLSGETRRRIEVDEYESCSLSEGGRKTTLIYINLD